MTKPHGVYRSASRLKIATLRRVSVELVIFVLLSIFFYSSFSGWVHRYLEIGILSIILLYILVGISLYPKARSAAESLVLEVFDDHFQLSMNAIVQKVSFTDICSVEVGGKNKADVVVNLKNGEKVGLQGLERSKSLYEELVSRGFS